MTGAGERAASALHLALAALVVWLVASSPWVELYRRLPPQAGWITHAHVWLGVAALALVPVYGALCLRCGRWRSLLPWAGGWISAVGRDLAGLARGRLPSSEGGGLLPLVQGLLLLAVAAAGITGALWIASAGTAEALDWRQWHIVAARAAALLLLLHLAGALINLLEFIRG